MDAGKGLEHSNLGKLEQLGDIEVLLQIPWMLLLCVINLGLYFHSLGL